MNQKAREHINHIISSFGVEDTGGAELSRLLKHITIGYESAIKARMKDERLSGPRWRVLLHLYMAEVMDKPGVSPTDLSHARGVSKNTISTLLRSLEEQGLVTRSIAPHDRRSFVIRLTEEGRALIRDRSPEHLMFLNELASDLTAPERQQLITLLRKLYQSVIHHGGLPENYCQNDEVKE